MYAVEFTTRIRESATEVPQAHRQRFKDPVRVILLAEERIEEDEDMIARLLADPLHVPGFTPLTLLLCHLPALQPL